MARKQAREGTPHDFTIVARRVVERAIGEKLDGSPLDPETKNPRFKAMGKTGGPKGGRARAKVLSPERRREIARKAAKTRWK